MKKLISTLFVLTLLLTMTAEIGNGNTASAASGVKKSIHVYDQSSYTASEYATSGGTLQSNGCGLFSLAHAIQWLDTNDYSSKSDYNRLLKLLLDVSKEPPTSTEKGTYASYLQKAFGFEKVSVKGNKSSLKKHFDKGGVVLMNCWTYKKGGHYILAVGYSENKKGQFGLHIVDSQSKSLTGRWDDWKIYDNKSYKEKKGKLAGDQYWIPLDYLGHTKEYDKNKNIGGGIRIVYGLLPASNSKKPSKMEIIDVSYPATYNVKDKGFNISSGVIQSNKLLKSVSVTLYNNNDPEHPVSKATIQLACNRFNLKALDTGGSKDRGQKFSKIKNTGNYTWKLVATDTAGQKAELTMKIKAVDTGKTEVKKGNSDRVTTEAPTKTPKATATPTPEPTVPPVLALTNASLPKNNSTLQKGKSFELKGTISSNELIASVVGTIYDTKTGKPYPSFSTKTNPVTVKPKAKSFNIYKSKINTGLKFAELPVGKYRLEIKATTQSGYKKTLVNRTFSIKKSSTSNSNVEINKTNFPDNAFRKYLLKNTEYTTDGEKSYYTEKQLRDVFYIDVSNKGISSLRGIEFFTSLGGLNCSSNKLTSLDISKNAELTLLDCDSNKLTSLDISKNAELSSLACSFNELTSLNVSKNTKLRILYCVSNNLTSLDVSKCTDLTYLNCSGNKLAVIDVSKNTALEYFDLMNNRIKSLDVSKNVLLTYLNCFDNDLTSLKLGNQNKLHQLDCRATNLTNVDISNCPKLEKIIESGEPEYNDPDDPYAFIWRYPKDSYENFLYVDKGVKIVTSTGTIDTGNY